MGQRAADRTSDDSDDAGAEPGARRGLGRALALTVASTAVWGVAHVSAGRRAAGIALMTAFVVLLGGGAAAVVGVRGDLKHVAVRRDWLAGIVIGILVLALLWAAVVIRSYQVVRPRDLGRWAGFSAGALVVVLAAGVCVPLVWAARDAYTLRDAIGTIFHGDAVHPPTVNVADPWRDKPRVNILLLGGDGGKDRTGVRTDSMTVASIDTRTGDTVLFSLPRNLQHFPVISRLRSRWPYGFTGIGAPGDEGLLNEMFQDAEDIPALEPGYGKGRRGPALVSEEISYLIGQPVDYYVLVNLFGFADVVDAIGGVQVHIAQDIPYGGPEDGSAPTGVLKAGDRTLDGKEALWFGRSRTSSDDFARMGRQKCLMKAIAEQADPQKVLLSFQRLAGAAKKTISTNIPASLLPALVDLSGTMKHGAQVTSLMYVPPQFHVDPPEVSVMRKAAARAIDESEALRSTPSPTPSNNPVASGGPSAQPSASNSPEDHASASPGQPTTRAISLADACG